MDIVLKLRELRRLRGLSQRDVARLTGIGEKTISSFETAARIGSLKVRQLEKQMTVVHRLELVLETAQETVKAVRT